MERQSSPRWTISPSRSAGTPKSPNRMLAHLGSSDNSGGGSNGDFRRTHSMIDTAQYRNYVEKRKQRRMASRSGSSLFNRFNEVRTEAVTTRRPIHKLDLIAAEKHKRITYISLSGLLLYVVSTCMIWDWNAEVLADLTPGTPLSWAYLVVKILIALSTLVVCILIVDLYLTRAMWAIDSGEYWSVEQLIKRSKLKWSCAAELLVHIIIPLPGGEHFWGFGDKLGVAMFARLYLLVRRINDKSALHQRRHIIKILLQNAELRVGWPVALLVWIKDHLGIFFCVSTVFVTTFMAYGSWVIERDQPDTNFSLLSRNFYFMVVTGTTIGYGDILPTKTWARVLAMIQGIWGIWVVILFGSIFIAVLEPTEVHKYGVAYVNLQEARRRRMQSAVILIQSTWRYSRLIILLPEYMHLFTKANNKFRAANSAITRWRAALHQGIQESTDGLGPTLEKHSVREAKHSAFVGLVQVLRQQKRTGLERGGTKGITLHSEAVSAEPVLSRAGSLHPAPSRKTSISSKKENNITRDPKPQPRRNMPVEVVDTKILEELRSAANMLKNKLSDVGSNVNQARVQQPKVEEKSLPLSDEATAEFSLLKQQSKQNKKELNALKDDLSTIQQKVNKLAKVLTSLNETLPLANVIAATPMFDERA